MDFSPALIWAVVGIILTLAEIFTTSFFLIFFGVSALVVALLKYFLGLENLAIELLVFALLGMAGILIFRKKVLSSIKGKDGYTIDRHQQLVLSQDLPAHRDGRVMYQGVSWMAYNEGSEELKQGEKAIIVRTEGVKLILRKEKI